MIKKSETKRTKLSCPCRWESGEYIIEFRHGLLKIFLNGNIVETLSRDDFDLSVFLDDDEMFLLLDKHGFLDKC